MELTPSIYKSLIPTGLISSKYNKISWADVSSEDKKTFKKCYLINDSLKFSRFEYKASRKTTRVGDHHFPGYEGIRADITTVFESSCGEIGVFVNPANYNLFVGLPGALFDEVSEYPRGYCPSSVSPSAIIRTHCTNLFRRHSELDPDKLYELISSDEEVAKAYDVIKKFGDSNVELTSKFESRLRTLDPLNDDSIGLLRDFKQISESLLPFISNKYDIHTITSMIRIAYSHKSEIKNLTEDKIAQLTMLRQASIIHDGDE